jgi:hypothetical protein
MTGEPCSSAVTTTSSTSSACSPPPSRVTAALFSCPARRASESRPCSRPASGRPCSTGAAGARCQHSRRVSGVRGLRGRAAWQGG